MQGFNRTPVNLTACVDIKFKCNCTHFSCLPSLFDSSVKFIPMSKHPQIKTWGTIAQISACMPSMNVQCGTFTMPLTTTSPDDDQNWMFTIITLTVWMNIEMVIHAQLAQTRQSTFHVNTKAHHCKNWIFTKSGSTIGIIALRITIIKIFRLKLQCSNLSNILFQESF